MKTKNLFAGFFCFALITASLVNAGHESDAKSATDSFTFYDNVFDFLDKFDGNSKATILIEENEDFTDLFNSDEFREVKELQLWDSALFKRTRPMEIDPKQFDLMLLNIDQLDKLVLRGFRISKDDAVLLADTLKRTGNKIKALELDNVSSDLDFLEPIIEALPATDISKFSLNHVRFRMEDIDALIAVVPESKLSELSLEQVIIGNRRVMKIAEALAGKIALTITAANKITYKAADFCESLGGIAYKSKYSSRIYGIRFEHVSPGE